VLAALGKKLAGVMGNSDAWVDQLLASSRRTDEKLWHLPLPPDYRKLLDSNVADMKNIGGPYGGALTAGIFLQEFVDGVPWVHLDIAGVMDSDADEGWLSKGATGFGVRLLLDALAHFEPPAANGRG
jgi:leucyl aminopeptidase